MSARARGRLLLGVDGGGSRTAVALWDRAANRVAWARGGPSAVVGVPSRQACRTLASLIDASLATLGATLHEIDACVLGLSGIDFADEHAGQVAVLAEALGLARLLEARNLVNDGIVALWGASPEPAAAILQHGTAITSAYRARFGGETCFDHLDAGRQHDLRREATILVARMIDGRATRTSLADRVLAHLGGIDPADFHETIFRRRAVQAVAGLAPVVFAAWTEGDAAATALVEAALADYAATCAVLARHCGSETPHVALGGGVLDGAPPRFRERLAATVRASCPGARVGPPQQRPERGALLMASYLTEENSNPAEAFARLAQAEVQSAGDVSVTS